MRLRWLTRPRRLLLVALGLAVWIMFSFFLSDEMGFKNLINRLWERPVTTGSSGFCQSTQTLRMDVFDEYLLRSVFDDATGYSVKRDEPHDKTRIPADAESKVRKRIKKIQNSIRANGNKCFTFSAGQLSNWKNESSSFCSGNLLGYINELALLSAVVMDKRFCSNSDKGGEQIEQVFNQQENSEYLNCRVGFINISGCQKDEKFSYTFNNINHLNEWMRWIQPVDKIRIESDTPSSDIGRDNLGLKRRGGVLTIALQRYEYANLYHTMTDWYNAFLTMIFFNGTAADTSILLLDAHPVGALDSVWWKLFSSVQRIHDLPNHPVHFSRLAWSIMGYNSPMKIQTTDNIAPPLYEEFRAFFLSAYSIDPLSIHHLDCTHVSVLLIYRRDYLAHPRNPSGHVHRQIANEKQLEQGLRKLNPSFKIIGVQIDNFTMDEQLRLVTGADVLIGMHGAGMTHALFLAHNNAAVIELHPSYFTNTGGHFMSISQWRGLVYEQWTNTDHTRELSGHSTVVPASDINILLKRAVSKICPKHLKDNR